MSEYVNYAAGGNSCSYSSLGNYNGPYPMTVPFQGKVTSGSYIVPTWNAIGYEDLTAKNPSCSGYGNIQSAYGADAGGSCQTTYTSVPCTPNNVPPPANTNMNSMVLRMPPPRR